MNRTVYLCFLQPSESSSISALIFVLLFQRQPSISFEYEKKSKEKGNKEEQDNILCYKFMVDRNERFKSKSLEPQEWE